MNIINFVKFMSVPVVLWLFMMSAGMATEEKMPLILSGKLYARADGPIMTNPDWVPPVNRDKYPGYRIMEESKKDSSSWKHSTNRPGGKIKGGGTVKYRDYRSVTRQTSPASGGGTGKPGR